MDIERVQVEGGFLDGLDLRFSSGLNVLIGARGTGKTSVIELIRYALSATSHTIEAKNRSLDHARAVLDSGEVTVVLNNLVEDLIVSRTADEEQPRSTAQFMKPIVLSQTEVETLGLSDAGRLSLIDGFINGRTSIASSQAALINAIKTVYKEILLVESEISTLADDVAKIPALTYELKKQETNLKEIQGDSVDVANKQAESSLLSERLASATAREDVVSRFGKKVKDWHSHLERLLSEDYGPEDWNGEDSEDPIADLRSRYRLAIAKVIDGANAFKEMDIDAEIRKSNIAKDNFEVERKARILRLELDKVSEGTGELSRNITTIKGQLAQITNRESLLLERSNRRALLRKRRDDISRELENARANRYNLRSQIASNINQALGPFIKVEIEQSSQLGEYAKSLTDALKGSGIKYNDLAGKISENISPQELVRLVDNGDFEGLSELVDIPKERAARVISQLRDFGLADILTSNVQDEVRMSLLDGVDYKDVSSLSAGQRCTVILSIVLQHTERVLIIDQPEDHLDNGFIAKTIIKTLSERKGKGQVILSTHNANIPVLGEADLIIELTSDGRNGFVQVNKPLAHPDAVKAITTVMEGGAEAFASRAKFYRENAS